MTRHTLMLRPVLTAIVLGACSTTPSTTAIPKKPWTISPVETVRHGGASANGYFALGRAREGQGLNVQALDAYRKAVEADPAHAAAWNAIGMLKMMMGRPDEGLDALERAVNLVPSATHLRNNLGYALLLVGRDEDAARALRRAIELDRDNRRAWSNLATAYRRLGAIEQAEFAQGHASGTLPGSDREVAPRQIPEVAAARPALASNIRFAQASGGGLAVESAPTVGAIQPVLVENTPSANAVPVQLRPADPLVTIGRIRMSAPLDVATISPLAALEVQTAPDPEVRRLDVQTLAAALRGRREPAAASGNSGEIHEREPALVKVGENVFELRNGSSAEPSQAVRALASTPLGEFPALAAARYEIANGQGSEGLARRLAALLGEQGIARPRLTNQRPFNQPASVIQYRDGYRDSAEAFASRLPFRPTLLATAGSELRVDVRLVLGHDLKTSDACGKLGLCPKVAEGTPGKVAATAN